MYRWFDLNHFSWAGTVIRLSVGSVEALPGGTSSPSISLGANGWGAHIPIHPPLVVLSAWLDMKKYKDHFKHDFDF